MAPLASLVSLVLLAASAVPSVVAGPHCAKKHHGKPWSHQNATSPVGNGEAGVTSTLSSVVVSTSVPQTTHSSVVVSVSKPVSSANPTTIKPATTLSSFTRSTTHATQPTTSVIKPTTVKPTTTPKPTTVKPTTAAPTATAGTGSSSGNSDEAQYLAAHNSFRAQHGAAALTWSDELASKAQQWANGCKFQHSGGSLGPYGENLAAGTGSSYGISAAIKSWTEESKDYNPSNPTFSHFTQVVWKGTKQLGCAVQSCDGIFSSSYGKAKYYVCEYFPAGNVQGQFAQNVQA